MPCALICMSQQIPSSDRSSCTDRNVSGGWGCQAFQALRILCTPRGCQAAESLAGEEINLEGWDCYDAAVHCASICAGQRGIQALNVASPEAMHPRTHVVLAPGAPSSGEPFQATEAEEGLGCLRLLKATMSSMWCGVLYEIESNSCNKCCTYF